MVLMISTGYLLDRSDAFRFITQFAIEGESILPKTCPVILGSLMSFSGLFHHTNLKACWSFSFSFT